MEKINYLLGYENLKIYQSSDMFKFSLDSILLPNFVTLNKNISRILDIGSGNGVIPIILSTKTNCLIDGVEIQKESCDLAKKSILINNMEQKIRIINKDIKDYYKECETDTYDVIVSNPPFFKMNDQSNLNNSHFKTLARHEVNLNIEDIVKVSKKLLKNNGVLAIVHRVDRLADIINIMKVNNIEPKKIQFVFPKKNKEANILLIEGSKNGNPGLKILPAIIAHNDDGSYTKEIEGYFK